MEHREAFTSRAIKQPNIQMKLLMKVIFMNIEQKGWGNNANKDTLLNLQ
jgi:hypothetical protein